MEAAAAEMAGDGSHLPVIDLAEGRECIVSQIGAACRHWGGFQVINHGVSTQRVDEARAQSRRFFALPTSTKLKAKRMPGEFTGYGNGAVVNSETLNTEFYCEAITLGYRSSDAASITDKVWREGNPAFRLWLLAVSSISCPNRLLALFSNAASLTFNFILDHKQPRQRCCVRALTSSRRPHCFLISSFRCCV